MINSFFEQRDRIFMTAQKSVLFVIQNFEVKQGKDAAGYVEIVSPMLHSGLVADYQVLEFNRSYIAHYLPSLQQRFQELKTELASLPVVVYGAGIHTRQHWDYLKELNVVAFADKQVSLQGKKLFDLPIIAPEKISSFTQHVVISSKAFELNIEDELKGLSFTTYTLYKNSQVDKDYFVNMYEQIAQQCRNMQPDMLFYSPCHPQDNMRVGFWHQLKKEFPQVKFVVVWWDHDEQAKNYSYLTYERECLTWADVVIDAGNYTRLLRMRANQAPYEQHTNVENVYFHPTVFAPEWFYSDESVKKIYDVVIMGGDGGRRKYWVELLQREFPSQFAHIGGVYQGKKLLPMSEYADALRRAKIMVNTQTYDYRSDCKGKVREALGCGVFLLEEYNPETEAFLPEGTGYVFYHSEEELIHLIHFYLNNPTERQSVVQKGQDFIKTTFNAKRWTQRVFELADAQHSDSVYPLQQLHTVKSTLPTSS